MYSVLLVEATRKYAFRIRLQKVLSQFLAGGYAEVRKDQLIPERE